MPRLRPEWDDYTSGVDEAYSSATEVDSKEEPDQVPIVHWGSDLQRSRSQDGEAEDISGDRSPDINEGIEVLIGVGNKRSFVPTVSVTNEVSMISKEDEEDADDNLVGRSRSASKEQPMQDALGGLESARTQITEAIKAIQEQLGINVTPQGAKSDSLESPRSPPHLLRFSSRDSQGESLFDTRKSQEPIGGLGSVSGRSSTRLRDSQTSRGSQRRISQRYFRDPSAFGGPLCADVGENIAPRLPVNWPKALGVRKIAQPTDSESFISGTCTITRRGQRKLSTRDSTVEKYEDEARKANCRCTREPDSPFDQAWNIMGSVILLYDLVVVPVVMAWDVPFEGALVFLAWCSLSFWLMDLILSFFCGFFEDGELQLDARATARRYLRTWFTPDVLVVTTDLFSMIMLTFGSKDNSDTMGLRFTRFAKMGRLLRVMGLLRVLRAFRALGAIVERNFSEFQRAGMRVAGIAVCWIWMNHILACIWYAIGTYAPSDTGARWVELSFLDEAEEVQYRDTVYLFQYATSFHWAIAQTTLGAMEVASVNTTERLFNIICLLVGLFLGSSLISSLSAGMVEFRMSMQIRSHTMSTLRRYLVENNVNKKTALLVQRQAAARFGDTAMLTAQEVPALETLATGIRHKLHLEICQPHLQKHQLYTLWQFIDSQWYQQFCSKSVDLKFLRPEDELFLPGSESVASYFIISGAMEYSQVPESSPVLFLTKRTVEHHTWLSESTMWTHWIHVGKTEATQRSQVLAIGVLGFVAAMGEHFAIRGFAADYGKVFAERVLSSKPPHFPWPDDLKVAFTDFGDVVGALPQDLHVTIGSLALDNCKNILMRLWVQTQAQQDLRQEVEDGRSIVILSVAGEIERVVSLSVLHLCRSDGRVFVQLAKWLDGQAKPDVALPAVKCKGNESSDEAVQRLLSTAVAPLADGIEVLDIQRETNQEYSARFGVNTRYMRKVFYAKFAGALFEPECVDHDGQRTASKSTVSRTFSAMSSPNMEAFENTSVHFISHDNGALFYTWLREHELEHLKKFNKCPSIKRWLSTLSPPEVMVGQPSQGTTQHRPAPAQLTRSEPAEPAFAACISTQV